MSRYPEIMVLALFAMTFFLLVVGPPGASDPFLVGAFVIQSMITLHGRPHP